MSVWALPVIREILEGGVAVEQASGGGQTPMLEQTAIPVDRNGDTGEREGRKREIGGI